MGTEMLRASKVEMRKTQFEDFGDQRLAECIDVLAKNADNTVFPRGRMIHNTLWLLLNIDHLEKKLYRENSLSHYVTVT